MWKQRIKSKKKIFRIRKRSGRMRITRLRGWKGKGGGGSDLEGGTGKAGRGAVI